MSLNIADTKTFILYNFYMCPAVIVMWITCLGGIHLMPLGNESSMWNGKSVAMKMNNICYIE